MRSFIALSAALWEAVRFIVLFFLATARFNSSLSGDVSIFFIWLASAGLILIVALFMAGLYPDTYGLYLPLAAVLKGLQVVFGVALVFFLLADSSLRVSSGASAPLARSLSVILPVAGMDIIALLLLLAANVRRRRSVPSALQPSDSPGPDRAKGSGEASAASKTRVFFKKEKRVKSTKKSGKDANEESSLPEARVTDVNEEE
jgi:hypothetical protein